MKRTFTIEREFGDYGTHGDLPGLCFCQGGMEAYFDGPFDKKTFLLSYREPGKEGWTRIEKHGPIVDESWWFGNGIDCHISIRKNGIELYRFEVYLSTWECLPCGPFWIKEIETV